ncbi:MAG: thiol-disulfide oxidoreductase DCC family protein [Bacteroidota bacterium]
MDNPHLGKDNKALLLFDGVCNLCNGFVQFVIKIDPDGIFQFASLQSDTGQQLLTKYNLPTKELKSVVLIHQNKAYTHSDAPLEAARLLGGFWRLFYVFKILPLGFRNTIYNWIASNRYRWFGKQESCWLPTPDLQERFL